MAFFLKKDCDTPVMIVDGGIGLALMLLGRASGPRSAEQIKAAAIRMPASRLRRTSA